MSAPVVLRYDGGRLTPSADRSIYFFGVFGQVAHMCQMSVHAFVIIKILEDVPRRIGIGT
jgi:hypothetical protein